MRTPRHNPIWWAAFIVCAALTMFWVFASPRFSVPDEPAHAVKAAAVWRGELVGFGMLQVRDEGPGSIFRGGETALVRVPESYSFQTSTIPNCFIYDQYKSATCAPPFEPNDRTVKWTTWVGKYPPGYYVLTGWGSRIETGAIGFTIMRATSALIGAALLASAFASAAALRTRRSAVIGVALAAAPVVFFLAGSVNPNGLTACAAICLWASLSALWNAPPGEAVGRYAARVGVAAVLLLSARPDSLLWTAGALAVTTVAFATRERMRALVRERSVQICGLAVGVTAVAALVWLVVVNPLSNNPGDDPRGLGFGAAFRFSLGRSWRHWTEMIATFGWRSTPVPLWVHVAWLGALGAFLAWRLVHASTRQRVLILTMGVAVVITPAVLEAAQAAKNGFPWQGRYGLALYAGLPILAGFSARLHRKGAPVPTSSARTTPIETAVAPAVGVAVGMVQFVAAYVALHRYAVGSNGPWWFVGRSEWVPPISLWILVPWLFTATVAYTLFVTRAATLAPPSAPPLDLIDSTADPAGREGATATLQP
ncbi:MAG: DUF2142 domain-containing protein [Acidimicrobiia bacterium]